MDVADVVERGDEIHGVDFGLRHGDAQDPGIIGEGFVVVGEVVVDEGAGVVLPFYPCGVQGGAELQIIGRRVIQMLRGEGLVETIAAAGQLFLVGGMNGLGFAQLFFLRLDGLAFLQLFLHLLAEVATGVKE